MKDLKLTLLGIAAILLGIWAVLLSGLDLPTYHNGFLKLLGIFAPVLGVILSLAGFVRKSHTDKEQR